MLTCFSDIMAPETGNELTEPYEFNLMFPTPIGPSGMLQGYLRPETAQGIFLNYKFCSEQNNEKMPFGVAQVGKSYRNEIAPRGGLVRQREFTQAEIEFFVKPGDKKFEKFASVRHIELPMLPSSVQLAGKPMITKNLGQSVDDGTIANETLGYFIGRTFEFLTSVSLLLLKRWMVGWLDGWMQMFLPSLSLFFSVLRVLGSQQSCAEGSYVLVSCCLPISALLTLAFLLSLAFISLQVGVKKEHLRFRQHLPTEMAHYACDCWDAEIEVSSGWMETVGIADRSAYDLTVHAEKTKVDLFAQEKLEKPVTIEVLSLAKKAGALVGKDFKKDGTGDNTLPCLVLAFVFLSRHAVVCPPVLLPCLAVYLAVSRSSACIPISTPPHCVPWCGSDENGTVFSSHSGALLSGGPICGRCQGPRGQGQGRRLRRD